jgi:hypothetical protein
MRFATLISWALTASMGGYMLRTWLVRGGLRRERARAGGLPPQLIFGHMGLALTGLGLWITYTLSGSRALCWAAVGILTGVIALGICTVTLWTPFPARKPGVPAAAASNWTASGWDGAPPDTRPPDYLFQPRTPPPKPAAPDPSTPSTPSAASDDPGFTLTDEMIEEFFADPFPQARGSRAYLAALVPIVHGFGALATFVLAVMTASLA